MSGHSPDSVTQFPRFELQSSAGDLSLKAARQSFGSWLAGTPASELQPDLLLVLTELLTNARQASDFDESMVAVAARVTADRLTIRVTNAGQQFAVKSAMPDVDSERGRGLGIVAGICSSVEISQVEGDTTVTAELTLPGPV